MIEAVYKGAVIARSSDRTVIVEGNHYFPIEDVSREHLEESPTRTVCPWKGTASYYHVVVDGQRSRDAAWYYPAPFDDAAHVKDRVAFWRGVEVRQVL